MNSLPVKKISKNCYFTRLLEYINQIEDPRINRNKLHSLTNIIVIAICAIIGGSNNFVEIEQFGWNHGDWFDAFLDLKNGIPSHDTFNRVFSLIHPFELQKWLERWLTEVIQNCSQSLVRLDGKMLKSRRQSKDPLYFMRAWSDQNKSILAQIKIPYENNEITAIPMVLKRIDLNNKIITIDAIGTQKEIVKLIANQNADYVLALKANQHQFYKDVRDFSDSLISGDFSDIPFTYFETVDKDHGRHEIRKCWATENIDWMPQKELWSNFNSIIIVDSIVTKNDVITTNRRYFMSSLPGSAEYLLPIIRNHWSIENQLHWPLDVVFDEDRSTCRKGYAPSNFAFLRAFILSLLYQKKSKLSLKSKRSYASINFVFLMETLLNTVF